MAEPSATAPAPTLSARLRRLGRLELAVWRGLAVWLTRRRPGRSDDTRAFGYARDVTPVLCAFLFVSLLELPVFHLLIPWETVRLVALVVGVWGLLWMLGYLGAMRSFPHLLDGEGIRVRHGATVDVRIPWDAVASVTARRGSVPTNKPAQLEHEPDGTVAKIAILKQTRVRIDLVAPTRVDRPERPQEVVAVMLYADDPAGFVEAARAQVGRAPARRPSRARTRC